MSLPPHPRFAFSGPLPRQRPPPACRSGFPRRTRRLPRTDPLRGGADPRGFTRAEFRKRLNGCSEPGSESFRQPCWSPYRGGSRSPGRPASGRRSPETSTAAVPDRQAGTATEPPCDGPRGEKAADRESRMGRGGRPAGDRPPGADEGEAVPPRAAERTPPPRGGDPPDGEGTGGRGERGRGTEDGRRGPSRRGGRRRRLPVRAVPARLLSFHTCLLTGFFPLHTCLLTGFFPLHTSFHTGIFPLHTCLHMGAFCRWWGSVRR